MKTLRVDEYVDINRNIRRCKRDMYGCLIFPHCSICGKSAWHCSFIWNEDNKVICSEYCSDYYNNRLTKKQLQRGKK